MYCPGCPLLAHQAAFEFSRAILGPYGDRVELAVICLLLMAPLLMPRAAEHSVKGIISHHLIITVGGLYSHGKLYFNPFLCTSLQ